MRRLVTVTAVLTVLALVSASPATAAGSLTRSQVVQSLLTATQLGTGWHRYDGSGNPSADVQGCPGSSTTTVGRRYEAGRMFQYSALAQFVNEDIQSFRTRLAARNDFRKGLASFASCDTITVDGKTWHLSRLPVRSYADQQALFLLTGAVAAAQGDVPVTMFLAASRWGRHEVITFVTVGGALTTTQRSALRAAAVRLSAMATAKVARRLGR